MCNLEQDSKFIWNYIFVVELGSQFNPASGVDNINQFGQGGN